MGVNLRHGSADVAVFEIGKGYAQADGEPREWWRLTFALVGAAEPAAWNRATRPYDVDDAKGLIELLAGRLGLGEVAYAAEPSESRVPPRSHGPRQHRRLASRRSSASSTRAIVDAWELRTTGRVVVAELAIEGLAAGRLAAGTGARRGPLPGGRPRPRDRRPRGHARGRGPGRSSARTPGRCSATSTCSTSTVASPSRPTRRASPSASASARPTGR